MKHKTVGNAAHSVPKKLLSIVLSLCMLLSITAGLDFSAQAAGNTIASATSISLNTTNGGSITDNNPSDFYKLTLESSGRITLSATAYIYRVDYKLYNSNGEETYNPNTEWYYNRFVEWNEANQQSFISNDINLAAGTYYLSVSKWDGTGNYEFSISCAHSWTGTATKKATFNENGVMTYTCTACGATKTSAIAKIGTVSLSATNFTYSGKQIQPTVTVKNINGTIINSNNYDIKYSSGRKNVGKYSVKITFKGNYSGTKTLYFTINPKNTSISGLTAGSKKFTVKLKKYTTQTTGYEIQYATNSSFKSAKTVTMKNTTTSKTIKGLKAKKKYYVRVRTYKTVNGTKYYSSWSKAKTVTTKK